MKTQRTDLLIVGSGAAALAMALKMDENIQVAILTKEKVNSTNSAMAQGGIAAVFSEEDTFESHVRDTLVAGAGLCRMDAVRSIVEQAPDRIKDLLDWGVRFDIKQKKSTDSKQPYFIDDDHSIDLTREGGHTFRRILHFEDQTGAEIHRALLAKVRERKNIRLIENTFAIDLIVNRQVDTYDLSPLRCVGVYALDKEKNEVSAYLAKTTVLATGGAGKVYLYTSNWSGATGDGIAMAYRAGVRIANLEFMQFHPTCLYHPEARNFLITEALRGEGAELVNQKGEPFMKKYHPLGSLAPRDIVARSIDAEMKKTGAECAYLDIRKHSREYLQNRFPAIFSKCMEYGIDMSKHPIPVVPAAHYLCGGILAETDGTTDMPGLLALGETACTGLHGANRLASNSLLECLTMAHSASETLRRKWPELKVIEKDPPPWQNPEKRDDDEMIVITHMWDEIRQLMWNYVGIVRSTKRLERAQHRLKNILSEVKEYYSNMQIRSEILELRNIAIVADATVECALRRKESVGIHYSLDYPPAVENGMSQNPHDTILRR